MQDPRRSRNVFVFCSRCQMFMDVELNKTLQQNKPPEEDPVWILQAAARMLL